MKFITPIHLLTICLCICFSYQANSEEAPKLIDGIIAVVNGKPVSHRNVVESLKMKTNNGWSRMPEESRKQAYEKELNSVIENLIIEEFLIQSKFNISESQVSKYFSNLAKQNNLSLEQFKQALKSQNIDEAQFKINIRRQLQRSKVFRLLRPRVHVDDSEAKEFYKQKSYTLDSGEKIRRASHILIKVDKKAAIEEVAKEYKKIEKIYKELNSSSNLKESWLKLSSEKSQTENSKIGGDLGYFAKGEILKEISDYTYETKKGSISKPFRTLLGFHIVYVTDMKSKEIANFKEVKEKIKQSLIIKKIEAKFKDWIKEQKQIFAVKYWPIGKEHLR